MIFCSLKEYIHTLHERTGNGEGFVFFLSHTYKACPRRVAPHRTEREPRSFTKATTAHAARTYKKKYKPPPKKKAQVSFFVFQRPFLFLSQNVLAHASRSNVVFFE